MANSIWSDVQSNMPRNIFNFTVRYLNNSLATRKNLARWNLSQISDCSFCFHPESLLHVVNLCLQQNQQTNNCQLQLTGYYIDDSSYNYSFHIQLCYIFSIFSQKFFQYFLWFQKVKNFSIPEQGHKNIPTDTLFEILKKN